MRSIPELIGAAFEFVADAVTLLFEIARGLFALALFASMFGYAMYGIALLLKALLSPLLHYTVGYTLGDSSTIVLATLLGVAILSTWLLRDRVKEYRASRVPCSHGVPGGDRDKRCPACHKILLRKQDELVARHNEEVRKETIRHAADVLFAAEIKRLTEWRLQQTDYLNSLSPQDFEDVVARMFAQLGYKVEQTPYSNDMGRDIILTRDGLKYFVECKRFGPTKAVGRPTVQKLAGAMSSEGVNAGFLVTTGMFTRTAIEAAEKTQITLIGLDRLADMMKDAFPNTQQDICVRAICIECGEAINFSMQSGISTKTCRAGHTVHFDPDGYLQKVSPRLVSGKRYCDCGSEMRKVRGRRGLFWGCKTYPRCRKTKNV